MRPALRGSLRAAGVAGVRARAAHAQEGEPRFSDPKWCATASSASARGISAWSAASRCTSGARRTAVTSACGARRRSTPSGFAPGHENPPKFPLREPALVRRARDARRQAAGSARDRAARRVARVPPEFLARCRANLAATFQPEGDGLGSAENPLDPQIGDLRISWRELTLPPLKGRVSLRTRHVVSDRGRSHRRRPAVTATARRKRSRCRCRRRTLLFAALHALMLMGLTAQVSRWRAKAQVGIGAGDCKELKRWVARARQLHRIRPAGAAAARAARTHGRRAASGSSPAARCCCSVACCTRGAWAATRATVGRALSSGWC